MLTLSPERASYNGNTLASQARAEGSIPFARSKKFQFSGSLPCAVKHKVSARTAYALIPDRTHFALSEIYGCRQTVFPGSQAPDEKKPAM